MLKAFAITISLLLSLAIFVYYRTGMNQPVSILSGEMGPYLLVYKIHHGAYHKMAKTIDEVETFFAENSLPCPLAFGRYLHDPSLVDEDRLESHGGCAFSIEDERLNELIQKGGFNQERLEKKEYVIGAFEGSPSVGPFKVYPAVEKWLKKYGYQKEGPVIELYKTLGPDAVLTKYLFNYK